MPNLPSTYSRYVLHGTGSFDVLKLEDNVSLPSPRLGEVLVRVRAVALNNRDLQVAKGQYPGAEDKIIPCSDAAGEVVQVGEGVPKWKEGDKVMASFTLGLERGQMDDVSLFGTMLGAGCDGVLAQYRVLPAHALVAMPAHISFEEASTLPCAPVTVYNALFSGPLPIKPGMTVVLQGTGGVSVAGAQLVVAAGGNAIITSSSDEKLQRVKDWIHNSHNHGGAGRLHTINYKMTPDWDKEVLKLTKGGRGADKVVEIGGSGTLEKSINALRQGGEIDDIGYLAGGSAPDISRLILLKGALLRGILIGSRKHLEELSDFVETAKLKPLVDKVFEFDQAKEAYQFLSEATLVGKVVIRVA
ncbi:putative alcohol dehydrogenase [Rhodotorula diobovata]|uniref:Putative alcohol dehydrogenase n=1 Tax=Rhodotorula diobovata TaxID=5288 RepID=A0A5C5G079_9BASI|nr:putative alcohol dehydrogenase [Rhodotorula diobovata]